MRGGVVKWGRGMGNRRMVNGEEERGGNGKEIGGRGEVDLRTEDFPHQKQSPTPMVTPKAPQPHSTPNRTPPLISSRGHATPIARLPPNPYPPPSHDTRTPPPHPSAHLSNSLQGRFPFQALQAFQGGSPPPPLVPSTTFQRTPAPEQQILGRGGGL